MIIKAIVKDFDDSDNIDNICGDSLWMKVTKDTEKDGDWDAVLEHGCLTIEKDGLGTTYGPGYWALLEKS